LPSSYKGYQTARVAKLEFHPSNPVVKEILTDALGGRTVHLKFDSINPGDCVVVHSSGDVRGCRRVYKDASTWSGIRIPPFSAYPVSVRKYLKSGVGVELNGDLKRYAEKISRSSRKYGCVLSIIRELDAYEFKPNTRNQAIHYSFPPAYLRTAFKVYKDRANVCVESARLACALLRSKNIPSRTVTVLDTTTPFNHTWIQFYVKGVGWIDADPLLGKCPVLRESPYLLIDPDGNDAFETNFIASPKTRFRVMRSSEFPEYRKNHKGWGTLKVD
jgi:hypothetical protein